MRRVNIMLSYSAATYFGVEGSSLGKLSLEGQLKQTN